MVAPPPAVTGPTYAEAVTTVPLPRVTVRLARPGDLAAVTQVAVAAGTRFGEVGMAAVASDPPPPAADLAAHVADGTLWVACDPAVVGFLVGEVVDGTGHVAEVSVLPAAAGHGLGARLLTVFEGWAASVGLTELTLTTFTDVPWNRPYYERLGWHVLPPPRWGEGVREIRRQEKVAGLDAWPRCVMTKSVTQGELLSRSRR